MLLNIVLDLDECLLHTFGQDSWNVYNKIMRDPKYFDLRQRIFYIEINGEPYWGIKRPHLDLFLSYCFMTFTNVCVWSAGTKPYVKAVVKEIFKDFKQPHLVMTRNDVYYYKKEAYTKPLSFLFDRMEGVDETNTIMLDDKDDNFLYNPNNGIVVSEYLPDTTIESMRENEDTLLNLIYLFSTFLIASNLKV